MLIAARSSQLPVGCTSTWRPPLSDNFLGLVDRFAFRTAVSLSGILVSTVLQRNDANKNTNISHGYQRSPVDEREVHSRRCSILSGYFEWRRMMTKNYVVPRRGLQQTRVCNRLFCPTYARRPIESQCVFWRLSHLHEAIQRRLGHLVT